MKASNGPRISVKRTLVILACRCRCRCRCRYCSLRAVRTQRGVALPAVLALTAAVLALSGAMYENAVQPLRRSAELADRVNAFRAADAALAACVAALSGAGAAGLGAREWQARARLGAPGAWRSPRAFDGSEAFRPFAAWPGAAAAPACVFEPSSPDSAAGPQAQASQAQAFLITARGTGTRRAGAQQYVQAQVAVGAERVAYRWRAVAGDGEVTAGFADGD